MTVYASIKPHHIESTALADGDYELIPEPEGGYFEDPGNIV
jgi:hypothetical protein